MRAQLHRLRSTAPRPTNGNGNAAPPAQASPAPAAAPPSQAVPSRTSGQMPKPPAREPEPEPDEGPDPKTGKQLLAWAGKRPGGDARSWVYDWGRMNEIKGRVLDWSQDNVTKCFKALQDAERSEE